MKTPSKKYLRDKADTLFSKAVLKVWGEKCEICGGEAGFAHHYVSKGNSEELRYNIKNGVPICGHCHDLIHFSKKTYLEGIIDFKRGKEWYDYILKKSTIVIPGRVTIKYLKENIERLEKKK